MDTGLSNEILIISSNSIADSCVLLQLFLSNSKYKLLRELFIINPIINA